jgi:type IV pilus assembly protein PilP
MKRNRSTKYAVSLLLVALLFGCSKKKEEQPPPPSAPAPAAAPKPAAPAAPPVAQQLSSAQGKANPLDFRKRTDPFKPYAPVVAAPAPGAQQRARSEELLPIQSFEVSSFKVAGIIAGLTENTALLIDPKGKGYVVRQGMQIGPNDGRITRITSSAVEVVESFREDSGRVVKRKIVLTLAKKR